jgi:DNA-binding NarL/FixJ family response regulator
MKSRKEERLARVVIADDDPSFRRLLSIFLERMPQVEFLGAATNSREALGMVVARRPDLLLIDVDMPGTSGLETAVFVREHYPATRVIIVTLRDSEEVKAACLAHGVDGFVSKGSFQSDLPRAIDEALARLAHAKTHPIAESRRITL